MRPRMERNEVHLCDFPNGHSLSPDCWCEPTNIYWVTNKYSLKVLVVEHRDETPLHRIDVIADRNSHSRDQYGINEPDAAWITRMLNRIGQRPTLPPGDTV